MVNRIPPPAAVRTLQNDECFVYGDTPSGSDLMVAAEELQYGVGYRVTLNIDLLKSGRPENRQYSGDFCLSEQADGSIRVHDLWGGDVAEAPAGDACRDLYRPARE